MSSPATIQRFMPPPSPIDLTRSVNAEVIIIDSEDEINEPSTNRNNSNYHFNDNNLPNSMLGFDSQNIFYSSTRHSSNIIQDYSGSNINYNLRTGLSTNGSSPRVSTRSGRTQNISSSPIGVLINMFVTQPNNNHNNRHRHHALYSPYPQVINYGNSNSSGSSRPSMANFSARAPSNNDVQVIPSPPRRANNSPKPSTLPRHARDLDESHTLICAGCDELLHEKLWALSNCGHVVCGSCVDKYKFSEKKKQPCPSCNKTPKNIIPLYV